MISPEFMEIHWFLSHVNLRLSMALITIPLYITFKQLCAMFFDAVLVHFSLLENKNIKGLHEFESFISPPPP